MNLFRSEEHIRNWARYDLAAAKGIIPLENIVKVFSEKFFQKRLGPHYASRAQEYFDEVVPILSEIAW